MALQILIQCFENEDEGYITTGLRNRRSADHDASDYRYYAKPGTYWV
jgi:hypothetical protein